jgi:hypothetical protein
MVKRAARAISGLPAYARMAVPLICNPCEINQADYMLKLFNRS